MSKIANTLLVSIAAIAAGAAATAKAQDFQFAYNRYELETEGGRDVMLSRLERSVDIHCAAGETRALHQKQAAADCKARLFPEMVSKIGDPRLGMLFDGAGKRIVQN